MVTYCRSHPASAFIIVTESGMLHRLRRELPGKEFIPGPTDHCACADCRYMKMITLEKLLHTLETGGPAIHLDPQVQALARTPLERMLEWSKN
jgi:quinolinate synthase